MNKVKSILEEQHDKIDAFARHYIATNTFGLEGLHAEKRALIYMHIQEGLMSAWIAGFLEGRTK